MVKKGEFTLKHVLEVYEDMLEIRGYASCGLVARALGAMGIRNRRGNPPSRQSVHRLMKTDPKGRKLLAVTKERTGYRS